MSETCPTCRDLLSEGLDLCVRARGMDAVDRRASALAASVDGEEWEKSGRFDQYVDQHNIQNPDRPIDIRSATMPLWYQVQYETDLADWERRTRHHLMQGCVMVGRRMSYIRRELTEDEYLRRKREAIRRDLDEAVERASKAFRDTLFARLAALQEGGDRDG